MITQILLFHRLSKLMTTFNLKINSNYIIKQLLKKLLIEMNPATIHKLKMM